ncbi:hypothetical protein ACOSQ4_025107 [Xanthoceras sorbifolium]
MRRLSLICFLLVWLLLANSQHHRFTIVMAQAVESVQFKVRPLLPSSSSRTGRVKPTWDAGKKFHKTPSGPNPVGNHHPPSRN